MALVIRDWKADSKPVDTEGNFIVISGREDGIVSYLLTLMGIDVTTTIKVSAVRVEIKSSSLAGTDQRLLPLSSMCSTYYGYHKPWQVMATLAGFGFFFGLSLMSAAAKEGPGPAICGLVVLLLGIGGGILYYFLNKRMTLGFVENSGVISAIAFKRSVIEGKNIDQNDARRVCEIVQDLIEQRVA